MSTAIGTRVRNAASPSTAVGINILNSYVSDIKAINADSQAINGYNGAGPFTIENNYLEAAGENVLFGGGDPAVTNLVPSDIVLRRNHLFKPLEWRNAILSAPAGARATSGSGGGLAAGTHYFRVVATMATRGPAPRCSAPSVEVSATVSAGGRVTLSWSAVPGADKYRVYRGTSAGAQTKYLEHDGHELAYPGTGEIAGTPAATGTKWVVKNTFELKNAQRVTRRWQSAGELLGRRAIWLCDRSDAAQRRRRSVDQDPGRHLYQQHRASRPRGGEHRGVRRFGSDAAYRAHHVP